MLIVLAVISSSWDLTPGLPSHEGEQPAPDVRRRGRGTLPLGNVLVANLLERSIFNAAVLYLPPFLMLNYGLGAANVAPALALVAIGTIVGNTLGGWLGDRFPRALVFVVAQLTAGCLGLALFGLSPGLVVSVMLGGLFGLSNATSRPAFWRWAPELSPRYTTRSSPLSLTNQGGSSAGLVAGRPGDWLPGADTTLAVLTICGGLGAAALAVPLVHASAGDER